MIGTIPQLGLVVQNDSGLLIPAWSVVVVTGVTFDALGPGQETTATHHVTQYGCGRPGNVMVTGPSPISVGRKGIAYYDPFLYVAIDPGVSKPNCGEEWGPIEGSWSIARSGKGFFAQGYASTGDVIDRAMFVRTYVRAAPNQCWSSSSSSSTSSQSRSSSSSSVSASSSSSAACGCITVVTSVSCSSSGLTVTYGQARGCC